MNSGEVPQAQAELLEAARMEIPGLRAKRAIAITVLFFGVQILVSLALAIGKTVQVAVTHGKADARTLSEAINGIVMPSAIAGELAAAWMVFWMVRRTLPGPLRNGSLASLGWRKAVASETARATLAGCLLSLLYLFVLVRIAPPTPGQHFGPLATASLEGGWTRLMWSILALALAPPIEEFLFRGVLLEGLSNSVGVPIAAGIVTLGFVATHVAETLAYWPAWAGIFLMAGAALFFRLRTRSLVPAIGLHFGYNLILVVTAYAGSA